MNLSIIVAVSDNNIIGIRGQLPWYQPEDLKRFKQRTTGHVVVMGRKTAESILQRNGSPLPNRRNVVLTSNKEWKHAGFEVLNSWQRVEQLVWEETIAFGEEEEVFVIGGETLYKYALPFVDRLYVTHVHCVSEHGDASFPVIDRALWNPVNEEWFPSNTKNPYCMTFTTYARRRSFVDLTNARLPEQKKVMEQIEHDSVCPFCRENLARYHHQPILGENESWILTRSQWPYDNTRVHLLLILKRHAERLNELSPTEWADMHNLLGTVEHQFSVRGGAICMRFGETRFSAGSVRHLHLQFIVPDVDRPNFSPVRFKIGTV